MAMTLPNQEELEVDRSGTPIYPSPLRERERFIDETARVLVSASTNQLSTR
jgi:hypothetical protein